MFEVAKITNKLITNNLRSILEQNNCGSINFGLYANKKTILADGSL